MLKKKFPSLASIGSDGNTAFLRAARAGHLDKVLEQLKNNVDINTSNANITDERALLGGSNFIRKTNSPEQRILSKVACKFESD
ncbi:hypothetical protein GE061_016989 [Apolygus lucorum]|uniref:Uncharacterized protein n=1 Tax=Apolygus lucorum TaxID=248454 RepID=A0A8S9XJS9_APOLU|nr:hypothetical protein GE061_016989 [Apolygus lucorum]